jgi:hypothetical protein
VTDGVIEARYRLTESEYLSAQKHGCWKSWRWFGLAIPFALLLGIDNVFVDGEDDYVWLIWSLVVAGYLVLFFQVLLPRRARRIFTQTKSLQNSMLMRVSGDRVEFESASGDYRLPWLDIHKLDEFSGLFAIYPSSVMVVLIPEQQVGQAVLTYSKERLAEAGLPDRGKARRA